MDWDAIGAIGEIVGAMAVVISLAYLAIQIRKQTLEAKLAATRELAGQGLNLMAHITSDFETTAAYGSGIQNYEDLPDDQRLWLAIQFQQWCRVMEQYVLHTEHSTVDPVYFESFTNVFAEGMTYPGFQQWWCKSKNLFSEKFQAYVEDGLIAGQKKGYQSTFKKNQAHQIG